MKALICLFLLLILCAGSFGVGLWVMMVGWGIPVASWGVIIAGFFIQTLMLAGIQGIAALMKD